MTKYNIEKASKKLQDKDITIEILNKEVTKLNTDNQDLKEALQKQKDHYISRHNSILQKLDIRHSIKLKEAIEAKGTILPNIASSNMNFFNVKMRTLI